MATDGYYMIDGHTWVEVLTSYSAPRSDGVWVRVIQFHSRQEAIVSLGSFSPVQALNLILVLGAKKQPAVQCLDQVRERYLARLSGSDRPARSGNAPL